MYCTYRDPWDAAYSMYVICAVGQRNWMNKVPDFRPRTLGMPVKMGQAMQSESIFTVFALGE